MLLAVALLTLTQVEAPIPVEPTPRLGKGWYAFSIAGQVADAASTHHFRIHGLTEGNRLGNAFVDKRPLMYGAKVGVGVFGALAGSGIYRYGVRHNDKAMRIFGRAVPILIGGIGFYAGVKNEIDLAATMRRRRAAGR